MFCTLAPTVNPSYLPRETQTDAAAVCLTVDVPAETLSSVCVDVARSSQAARLSAAQVTSFPGISLSFLDAVDDGDDDESTPVFESSHRNFVAAGNVIRFPRPPVPVAVSTDANKTINPLATAVVLNNGNDDEPCACMICARAGGASICAALSSVEIAALAAVEGIHPEILFKLPPKDLQRRLGNFRLQVEQQIAMENFYAQERRAAKMTAAVKKVKIASPVADVAAVKPTTFKPYASATAGPSFVRVASATGASASSLTNDVLALAAQLGWDVAVLASWPSDFLRDSAREQIIEALARRTGWNAINLAALDDAKLLQLLESEGVVTVKVTSQSASAAIIVKPDVEQEQAVTAPQKSVTKASKVTRVLGLPKKMKAAVKKVFTKAPKSETDKVSVVAKPSMACRPTLAPQTSTTSFRTASTGSSSVRFLRTPSPELFMAEAEVQVYSQTSLSTSSLAIRGSNVPVGRKASCPTFA